MPSKLLSLCRWSARIASLISFGLLAAFAFGSDDGIQSQAISLSEMIGFLFFPVGIVAGMLIAWRWEIAGGAATLFSLIGFYVWHFVQSGNFASGPFFFAFALPGLALLVIGLLAQRQKNGVSDFDR